MNSTTTASAPVADALIDETIRDGSARFDAARVRLQDEMLHLHSRLKDLESAAGTRVKQAAHRTDETVHAHPYAAMGVAAAAGVLIGWLMHRR